MIVAPQFSFTSSILSSTTFLVLLFRPFIMFFNVFLEVCHPKLKWPELCNVSTLSECCAPNKSSNNALSLEKINNVRTTCTVYWASEHLQWEVLYICQILHLRKQNPSSPHLVQVTHVHTFHILNLCLPYRRVPSRSFVQAFNMYHVDSCQPSKLFSLPLVSLS